MPRVLLVVLLLWVVPLPAAAESFGPILNDWRQAKNLQPMTRSDALTTAARRHANDMAKRGYFSHTGRNGSSVKTRARRAGYRACLIAENIAKGQRSAGEVMQDWVKSGGHRRNMNRRDTTHYGYAVGPGDIHVLVVARRC